MQWHTQMPKALYLGVDGDPVSTKLGLTTRHDDIQRVINELLDADTAAIDTETTGLVNWRDTVLYWSLAWGDRRCTLHASLLPFFAPCFANKGTTWCLANAKYDMHMLANSGAPTRGARPPLAGPVADVCVAHSLLHDDRPHNLKAVALERLGWTWAGFEDQFGKITVNNPPARIIQRAEAERPELLIEYAANDAWGTLNAYLSLKEELQQAFTLSLFNKYPPYIETLWDFFTKVEVPYTKVLWKMERRGILMDKKRLDQARPEALSTIELLERKMVQLAGFNFNPKSNPAIASYAQAKGLKPIKYTGTGAPSWDESAIEHYAPSEPLFEALLEHRQYSKLLGTYIDGLAKHMDPSGRIHSTFNQDVARTGRLSSKDPNLQNIPRPENDVWNLRGAFITTPGWKIIAADYSQLEMRLLAAAAEEQAMADVFIRGWDIHAGNAAMMYGLEYEDVNNAKDLLKKFAKLTDKAEALAMAEQLSPGVVERATAYAPQAHRPLDALEDYLHMCSEARSGVKSVGFGLNYGMGPRKLARDLKCSVDEAKEKIRQYKEKYTAVDRFMREAVEEGNKYGYAFTIMGRRRKNSNIAANDGGLRALGERVAVNTQIQGSAADVTRFAQINIDDCGYDDIYELYSMLQIHDELVFECPEENVPASLREIEEHMAHPFSIELMCPLEAEAGVGDSWGEAK